MPLILDGKKARESRKNTLIEKIKNRSSGGVVPPSPCLAIIQVGGRTDSTVYIGAKKKFASEIGVSQKHLLFPESVKQEEVLRSIEELNADASVQGIIVQLPLPTGFDKDFILNTIAPAKDVDGLSAKNVRMWSAAHEGAEAASANVIWPATTRGIRELLEFYSISLKNKKVAIVGRSALVGQPTAAMCRAEGAIVTVCHRQTADLAHETQQADILIVAAGAPRLIGAAQVHPGQVVIDVGTTPDPLTGKLIGDVDFDTVSVIIGDTGAITPVPGGVGQMTVLGLFENLIDAWYNEAINS